MGRKRFARREHPGVVARRHVAYIEMMAGREIPELRKDMPDLPKKRAPRAAPNPDDTEAPVLRAVGDLLAMHPKVLFAVRQNSGSLPYENASGAVIPVWFYKLLRKPQAMTIVDYWGFLVDHRPFAFECKRPSWKEIRTDHEMRQWAFIHMIVNAGGVGSFVTSADFVKGLLA